MRVETTHLTPTPSIRVDALNVRLLGMHVGFSIGGTRASRRRVLRLTVTCCGVLSMIAGAVLMVVAL